MARPGAKVIPQKRGDKRKYLPLFPYLPLAPPPPNPCGWPQALHARPDPHNNIAWPPDAIDHPHAGEIVRSPATVTTRHHRGVPVGRAVHDFRPRQGMARDRGAACRPAVPRRAPSPASTRRHRGPPPAGSPFGAIGTNPRAGQLPEQVNVKSTRFRRPAVLMLNIETGTGEAADLRGPGRLEPVGGADAVLLFYCDDEDDTGEA